MKNSEKVYQIANNMDIRDLNIDDLDLLINDTP